MHHRIPFLLLGFLFLLQSGIAQTTPFLSDDEILMLKNEVSGDRAFEHIRVLSQWHRNSGMEGFFKAADYVMQAARDAGLQDVKFIEQPMEEANYTARAAELWLVEPVEVKLADIGDHAVYLADGSHSANVSAELVWIGTGSLSDLEGKDIRGKLVLTNGSPGTAAQHAVWDGGAIGIISYHTSENRPSYEVPDQIAWSRIPMDPPPGKQGTFAFILPPRKGEQLKRLLESDGLQDVFATGKPTRGGRAVVKAIVKTDIGTSPGRTGFVEGWIRGGTYTNQQIVMTAHLQEEQGSANDDGSGCASLLEIARTLNKLISEGKIQRPLRDIRFWWTDEIYSEYRYFRDHPEEPKKFLANIHQDMVGARQSMGSRVQHLIFAPHSRTSYLDAIFESIGTYLIETNNAFLAASRDGGLPRPFTRPIYSTRGSQEGYNARFVPYFNSSDHMCFVEGIIGVPAVATINWDDPYIHSSDDDLWQIDQTQLQRNAFLMCATAYVLAFADEGRVPLIAGETAAQGERRLSNDLRAAIRIMQTSHDQRDRGWADANILIEQGIQRELRAVASIGVFQKSSSASTELLTARLRARHDELREDLRSFFRTLYRFDPPALPKDSVIEAVSKKIPSNVKSLETYFTKRGSVTKPPSLHPLMRDEVYNFVDGRRNYFEIYKAVRAEQLAGGSWYYGTVKLEDVVTLLDAAVQAGALTLARK
jgi:hypothetical protein